MNPFPGKNTFTPFGEVETVAHLRAAQFFAPQVSFLIDIGGQDIK